MAALTDTQAIEVQIQAIGSGRIKVGDVEPNPGTNDFNISRKTIDQKRVETEQGIVAELARFYVTPLALTNPETVKLLKEWATKLTSFEIWTIIHPQMTIEDLPASVMIWKDRTDQLKASLAPADKETLQPGRDIILAGESLLTAAGDQTTANVYFTNALPFGATSS